MCADHEKQKKMKFTVVFYNHLMFYYAVDDRNAMRHSPIVLRWNGRQNGG